MFSTVLSAGIYGVKSKLIHVEADIGNGLPSFAMVGYLSTQVREAQERVRTALKNSGFIMKPKKITVNLAPADLHKSGTAFDLPIAVAIAAGYGLILQEELEQTLIIGELGLDGHINGVPGALAVIADAASYGCRRCIVPLQNKEEGNVVPNMTVIGVSTLAQLIEFLQGNKEAAEERYQPEVLPVKTELGTEQKKDFADISGQYEAKRAALIAAAGFHNLLLIGPPGAGKSMIANRIPTILPDLTLEEAIELSRIYSVLGMLPQNGFLLYNRPFRCPHHTITAKSMGGGGMVPKPGEISLAHNGVLFLDELPEFKRETLEILRQPMENREITITRCGYAYDFPADFMLVAAMNPCPCGYYPDMTRCRCSYSMVRNYVNRISMPFLDRIDLTIEVAETTYEQIQKQQGAETSEKMKEKVEKARLIQKERFKEGNIKYNSRMRTDEIQKYCILGAEEQRLMEKAFYDLKLSARGYHKILKVSRTIADLDEADMIRTEHLQEALCYKSLKHDYW